VPRLDPSLIEVYVFRRRARRVEFLLLRRAPDRWLPGSWQPVTGGLRARERAVRGALREIREETGLSPRRLWRLETVSAWFDPPRDAVRVVILFAAEIGARDRVRLSGEHTAFRFAPARTAARQVVWDSQRRGLAAVGRQVLRGGARARVLEIAIPAPRR
jgi:8-oxo-dGTP pyrophosphatase MutT (NUDIX family)